jgi:hypothetical protein
MTEIKSPLQVYVPSKSQRPTRSANALTEEVCPVSVDRGDSRWSSIQQCGKPIKAERPVREGHSTDEVTRAVCGFHASVYDRALKKATEADAFKGEASVRMRRDEQDAERISKALGVEVEVITRFDRHTFVSVSSGYVRVEIAGLLTALDLPAGA